MVALSSAAEVETVLRQVAQERGPEAPLLVEYGQLLLHDGPIRFLSRLDEHALGEFIARRFDFAQHRGAQPFSLRLDDGPEVQGALRAPFSVVEVVIDDRPFLVDSIQNVLIEQDLRILALLHPVLRVKRNAEGKLQAIVDHGGNGGANESHMCFLVDPIPAPQRQALLEELRTILYDVVRSVDDYPAVKAQLERLKEEAKSAKGGRSVAKLIDWFQDRNFIFMGYLPFHTGKDGLVPRPSEGLGLFHPDMRLATHHEALAAQSARFLNDDVLPTPFFDVEETTVLSRMHHRARVTALLIGTQGEAERKGAAVMAGIFTDRSLRVDVREIPVVRDKIDNVIRNYGVAEEGYKHKEVLDFFNGLPRFELFRLSEPMLERMLAFFLGLVDQPRTEVLLLLDDESNALRLMVALPGREFPRATLQQVRERVEGLFSLTAQSLYVVRVSTFGILTLVFSRVPGSSAALPDAQLLDSIVREELLSRDDRLVRLWLAARGSALEERLARTLVTGLPEEYKVSHKDLEILADLSRLEALTKTETPQFVMRRDERAGAIKLALFFWQKLSLSRLMPMFNNLRVEVEEEETFEIALPERPAYLHTFLLHPPSGFELSPERHGPALQELIFNILDVRSENDPLNALLLSADLSWRQINLLQLYRNYLMQVGTVYTKRTINETLIRRSQATRALFGVFQARFDPDQAGREAAQKEAEQELSDAEREIDNLTEDRIFKGLHNLVLSTIRTNFYQDDKAPIIAVKLKSAAIEQLPSPRPLFEIYVYGPLMEGIHLRGDKIARGGIRYSDRPDDFRTEVLGLMATQMKKNALIVPLGSKGGFVVKNLLPYDGNARAAGDAQYREFIAALLSVTDNLEVGRPVPPPRVIRHDEDDPYLVVAADKGTAHLSDTANEVSEQHGFWLGDAFASGGSNGYDHKIVGITARGAWESVKRVFWEQGIDSQRDPVTVVGIGDMSGDVFGNGLLASQSLRLVGAFDHRHIFLDPDPDAESSYRERERLFRLPRSAWTDYDASLISEGGGIYPRNSKAIELSPQVQALLGTTEPSLSGEEVIRALLKAPVDLLWNGGIGTYIKSVTETNVDVGDPNNDAVRVNAQDVQARVIGEGGNLGLTQLARIDLDLAGCTLHTDAIDNAGGVNMSDHEVNLKILLGALMDAGQIADRDARNKFLHEMEPAVTAAVLRANFRQVLMISMDRQRSVRNVEPYLRLVDLLATEGSLDRRTEAIPNAQRFHAFQNDEHGVPRPVLAVLLAYTKMLLYRRLSTDPLMEDPHLEPLFRAYFPRALEERFDLTTLKHPLRSQIVATVATNRIIDQAGMTLVPELASYSGRSWVEVVQAYLLADAVVDGATYREHIYAQATTMPAQEQYDLLMALEDLLAETVRWLLLHADESQRKLSAEGARRIVFKDYCEGLPGLLEDEDREALAGRTEELLAMGLHPDAARQGAMVPYLQGYALICGIAADGGIDTAEAFELVALVDRRFRFRQIENVLTSVRYADPMQKRFGDGLLRSVAAQRHSKLRQILEHRAEAAEPAEWVDAYLKEREAAWKAYEATSRQVFATEVPEVVALAVLIGQLEGV